MADFASTATGGELALELNIHPMPTPIAATEEDREIQRLIDITRAGKTLFGRVRQERHSPQSAWDNCPDAHQHRYDGVTLTTHRCEDRLRVKHLEDRERERERVVSMYVSAEANRREFEAAVAILAPVLAAALSRMIPEPKPTPMQAWRD